MLSGFVASQGILRYSAMTDDMRRRAVDALDRMGAAHLAQRRMNEMSSGEARRVLLARALVTESACARARRAHDRPRCRRATRFMERVRDIAQGRHDADSDHASRGGNHSGDRSRDSAESRPDRGDGAKRDMLTDAALSDAFDGQMKVEQRDGYYSGVGREALGDRAVAVRHWRDGRSKLRVDGGVMLKHSLLPLVAAAFFATAGSGRRSDVSRRPGQGNSREEMQHLSRA